MDLYIQLIYARSTRVGCHQLVHRVQNSHPWVPAIAPAMVTRLSVSNIQCMRVTAAKVRSAVGRAAKLGNDNKNTVAF